MIIRVIHQYRLHEGGGKFYETLLIRTGAEQQSVLIKRYGVAAKSNGGGQIKIEEYRTPREAADATSEIWREKDSKKKGYTQVAALNHGFGLVVGGEQDYDTTEPDDMNRLRMDLAGHYPDGDKPGLNTADTILSAARINGGKGLPADGQPDIEPWKPTETADFGSW